MGILGEKIHYENLLQFLSEIISHALIITIFVMVMMLLIEYLTIQSKGKWSRSFEKNLFLQIIFAAIMGITPGCLGAYVVVSLYIHRVFSFAALVTVMIATSGDEAFVMFTMIPGSAVLIMLMLFLVSIVSGVITGLLTGNRSFFKLSDHRFSYHPHTYDCKCFVPSEIPDHFRKISFERTLLLSGGILFMIFLLSGDIGPHTWNWKRIVFFLVVLIEIFIVSTVPEHFLTHHLWEHVIKKHFLKVFLWTTGAFIVIHAGLEFLHLEEWVQSNLYVMLTVAVLAGVIPESGPHIIFITLFANGTIPFGILLANSIVQDGHGGLPLLAESRRNFLLMKSVNLLIGAMVGIIFLLLHG